MSAELPFQRLQRQFAAHLRDPLGHPPPPDVEPRRLQIYRELFYKNVESFLARAFPVLRRISTDDAWHGRVRDFYARHRCACPEPFQIPQEFLQYLQGQRTRLPEDPPFLEELCHYEWVELALAVAPDPPAEGVDPEGDLLTGQPQVSPLAWSLQYAWPVHRIGPAFLPETAPAQPTHLLVYRDAGDTVRFMQVNVLTALLLERLRLGSGSGRDTLAALALELPGAGIDVLLHQGGELLRQLRERGVLLGTNRQGAARFL